MEITLPSSDLNEALAHPLVKLLLDQVSDGVLVIDARTRRVLAMNPAASELLGYAEDQAVGCQCKRIVNAPACHEECLLERLLRDGTERPSLGLYYRSKQERVLRAKTRVVLLRAPDGTPLAAVEMFRDLREVEELRAQLDERRALLGLVGESEAMQAIFSLVEEIAPHDLPVLITGESGVGKERVADAIHHHSPRAARPFIKVNCAALSATLIESELFGHVRGAFTGANQERRGQFECADGGTLLLDEVGELPLELQAKLLRVLQDGEVRRVGSDQTRRVDVRVLAATNRSLPDEVSQGRFRQDLFYRLLGAHLHISPLRERPEDIPALVEAFLDRHADGASPRLSDRALRALVQRPWPGNVRELEHTVRLAIIRASATGLILPEHVQPLTTRPDSTPRTEAGEDLDLRAMEHRAIHRAMRRTEGNISQAARLLGIDRSTLWRKLQKLDLDALPPR